MERPTHGLTARQSGLARLIDRRISRRDVLRMGLAGIVGALGGSFAGSVPRAASFDSTLSFPEIAHGRDETHRVPPGYDAQVLLRWGDPILPGAPNFVPGKPSAEAQALQFGYDNDFLAFMPLPRGSSSSTNGLLCVNHERCTAQLMWPGMQAHNYRRLMRMEHCAHEMAAQGFSVVEIRRQTDEWKVVTASRYHRRISAQRTLMTISGPAAGHVRMQTNADPTGTRVIGTLNNCAGGVTPWGTVLTCEENIHLYFTGDPTAQPDPAALKRYGFGGDPIYVWGHYFDRFNMDKEPNEPNRFGWVVEIDPYDPQSTPVKRTALGRIKHEGATVVVSQDGRIVVYTGDDERFEYLYKFVSDGKFVRDNAAANRELLNKGTLYVARFEANGRMRWLPMVYGQGPLTAANGFACQADVLIEARRAADLLGATTLDRPEDVETHPGTGAVYVVLTNNHLRTPDQLNPANPRPFNKWGQIIELNPPRVNGTADHTADEFTWEFFLLAGNPSDAVQSARYAGPVSKNGWLACPDNVAFDPRGRIWIATDGQDDVAGLADSLYAADTTGPGRGSTRLFFNAPRGAEVCGPCFTPDGSTLFVAVQHPADEPNSTYAHPSTRWPDFKANMPPRPSVLAITKRGGGEVGS